MSKKTKNLEKPNLTLSILFLIFGILLCLATAFWLIININQTTSQIRQERSRIKALDRREEDYQKLQQDYQSVVDRYYLIDRAIPDQDNFIDFIELIEARAKKRDLELIIDFADQPELENNKLSFNLKIAGNQQNVLAYLSDIKNSIYYLEFFTLKISRAGSNNRVVAEAIIKVGVDETFSPNQISG